MKGISKNKRGISLIVLVITIIVMIILASAIILSLQSSGIIVKAKQAVTDTDRANLLEAANVAVAEWELDRQLGDITDDAETYVKEKLKTEGFIDEQLANLSVLSDGTVQIIPTIPTGFVMSTYAGEQKISDGLVIYETNSLDGVSQADAMTTYNQYVWVPVEGAFERVAWKGEDLTEHYVEPLRASIVNMDNISLYADEIAQYNAMKQSVETNGGFYVARYEAGLPDGKTTDTVAKDGTDDPVSKKGSNVWIKIAWDDEWEFDEDTEEMASSISYGDDSKDGAAKISEKTYANAERHLIYGVQWDATMNFMKDVPNPNVEGKTYIEDSTEMGWYSDNYESGNADHKTGIDVDKNASNMVKNIYDMAGNVNEWTYEAEATNMVIFGYRVRRGGCFDDYGRSSAISREGENLGYAWNITGFRMVMYIK